MKFLLAFILAMFVWVGSAQAETRQPLLKFGEAVTVRRIHVGYQFQTLRPLVQVTLERLPFSQRSLAYEAFLNTKRIRIGIGR